MLNSVKAIKDLILVTKYTPEVSLGLGHVCLGESLKCMLNSAKYLSAVKSRTKFHATFIILLLPLMIRNAKLFLGRRSEKMTFAKR